MYKQSAIMVTLDADIAEISKDSEAVNKALLSLLPLFASQPEALINCAEMKAQKDITPK
jgi:hypothetical protein